jgi:hypothetical protein
LKISEVHDCRKEVKGAWWLVAGSDENDKCLVSWAYLRGSSQKAIGQTQHLRTDFNWAKVCLEGAIVRDAIDCERQMTIGSNITFILKDPSGRMHYEYVDAEREPIDRIHRFTFCPKPEPKIEEAGRFDSVFDIGCTS